MGVADSILAEPVPIIVAGEQVGLRFDLLAFKRCEEVYGSVTATEELLASLSNPQMGVLGTLTAAALIGPDPKHRPIDSATVDGLLATIEADYDTLASALIQAWERAWPSRQADAEGKAQETSPGSPGHVSTTE